MKTFTLHLYDSRRHQVFDGVRSFVGEDNSGSFGILAGHARLMAVLRFGLARFHCGDEQWQYLALPGAVLYFDNDILSLMCRHFLLDHQYELISRRLMEELLNEEEQLKELHVSLQQMEEAMLKRMWELGEQGIRVNG